MSKAKRRRQQNRRAANVHRYTVRQGLAECPGCGDCLYDGEYRCHSCGAWFMIAGEFTGSDDDIAAEEYHRAEVERHESRECVRTAVPA